MKTKTVRFPMMVEPSFIQQVDEWSFANRIRTRAEAVRLLVAKGLQQEDGETKKADAAA